MACLVQPIQELNRTQLQCRQELSGVLTLAARCIAAAPRAEGSIIFESRDSAVIKDSDVSPESAMWILRALGEFADKFKINFHFRVQVRIRSGSAAPPADFSLSRGCCLRRVGLR